MKRILAFKPIVARKRLMKGGKLPKGWIPFHPRRHGGGRGGGGRAASQLLLWNLKKQWRTIVGRD